VGFNPLRQRLRGECPARFRVATTGISNGVYFIGREQFILNKRAPDRKKDLADLEALGEE
jgi:hypothetical protein